MNCETARERMLEADLSDLAPTGTSELSQHLGACPACRARAERVRQDTRTLGAVLDAARAQVPVDAAIRVAAGAARRHQVERRVWRRWGTLVPVALAAGFGALLLARGREPAPAPPRPAPPIASAPASGSLDVEAPAGTNVTVFQTDNPNIVVIWYISAEEL